jgi:hypothetical protein
MGMAYFGFMGTTKEGSKKNKKKDLRKAKIFLPLQPASEEEERLKIERQKVVWLPNGGTKKKFRKNKKKFGSLKKITTFAIPNETGVIKRSLTTIEKIETTEAKLKPEH